MNQGMKTVTLKTNFRGNSNFAAGMSVYIKKTYMSLVNVTGMFQVCADSLVGIHLICLFILFQLILSTMYMYCSLYV